MPILRACTSLILCTTAISAAGVTVKFDPSNLAVGPFPTDFLTTPDAAPKTGLRIKLPLPDCTKEVSMCAEFNLLNELDGFNLQPRIRVKFSGPVNASTVKPAILLVWLDNLTTEEKGQGPSGQLTAMNETIYDTATTTAYAKPDDVLDQHRRYALIVTDAALDTAGDPVTADPAFTACITSPSNSYCTALAKVVQGLSNAALPGKIISASVFTTLSATAWMERARDVVAQSPAGYKPLGTPVKAAGITAIDWKAQRTVNPVTFQTLTLRIPAGTLDGVDRISFGTYSSPNFLNAQQYIPSRPTGQSVPLPPSSSTLQVHAYVPSSPMPPAGYPVIIFGHGFGANSFVPSALEASTFAKAGFLTLAINASGHGGGPQSTVQLVQSTAATTEFAGFGRSVDLDGDGRIDSAEGCFLAWPVPVGVRDWQRQTVVDLLQLVNVVRSGVALEADGTLKLDGNRIHYAGGSLGAMYGTILHALDPRIVSGVMDVGGDANSENARQAPFYREYGVSWVGGARVPSLLNAGKEYNDNYVLRNQPVKVNEVAGAIEIQDLFAELLWLQVAGEAVAYAPHLTLSPLPNVPPKPTLFSYGLGDLAVPNPRNSALVRAAGMFDTSVLFRADLAAPVALQLCCRLPLDTHSFMADNTNAATLVFSKAMQQIAADFLVDPARPITDGSAIVARSLPFQTTAKFFEVPARDLHALNSGPVSPALDDSPVIRAITSATGIKSSVQLTIQPGAWTAIYGANLAASTADWAGLVANGQLPTSVANVSVTIGGKSAYVYFVSPNQINVIAPEIPAGVAQVVVSTNGRSTAPTAVRVAPAAPAFFQWGASRYAVTTRYPDNANLSNPATSGFAAARPGDVVILWATGFGPVSPEQPSGLLTTGLHTAALPATVRLGDTQIPVIGAALSPGLAGVYQIAIQLPMDIPTGDLRLKATAGAAFTPEDVYLFVAQ